MALSISSTSSNKRRQEFESNLERIQSMRIFSPFGSDLIKELSRLGYYEDLTPGIVLFREGDLATCWYILLSGAVNIILGPSTNVQDCAVPVQTLSAGSIFGESTSSLEPHSCTALIHTYTELLRVEQRDFGALWRRYSAQLHDVVILLSDKITETVSPNQLLKARSQMDQQHQVSVNRNKQNPSSDQQFVPSNRNRTRSVHEPTMTNHVSDQFDQQQKTEITQEHYHSDGETSIEQMKESEENREKPNNPSEPSKRQQHTVQIHQEQSVEDRFNSEKDNMQRPLSTSQIHHYQGHSDSESSLRRQRKSRQEHYYAKNDRYFSQQQLRPRVHSDGDRSVVFRGNRGNSLGRERFYSEKGVTPYSTPVEIGQNIYDTPPGISGNDDHQKYGTGTVQWIPETQGQKPAASMIELSNSVSPETKLMQAAFVLRSVMLLRSPNMIRDRKFHLSTFNRCMIGTEMVDWILHQRNAEELNGPTLSRMHAVGLWQALLEQGLLTHVTHEYSFLDKYLFYRWSEDDIDVDDFVHLPSPEQQYQAELELPNVFKFLTTVGPDALFRMVLQKPTYERNPEELELVYEELLHVKALSHLSTMVKRELAAVIVYEQHPHAGTVLFNQGDEGKSWYILLKGSVNVEIHGKGVVCTLHEGDDFGKLALVNDAPRAASITLREDNCQFLRVDKHDFNHILRDVEANTVRLKEHGQDVLVLEKIPVRRSAGPDEVQTVTGNHRYSVMAGKPEKMLEYLLETRIDSQSDDRVPDTFLEDFILTHIIFMASNVLSNSLKVYYQQGCSVRENFGSETSAASQQPPNEQILTCKRRVITFLRTWIATVGLSFFQDSVGTAFIEELYCAVLEDGRILIGLMSFVAQMESMMAMRERAMQMQTRRPVVILDCALYKAQGLTQSPVMPFDICLFRVYNSEHQYVTLKARVGMNAAKICQTAASRFSIGTGQGVELVEVTSSGKRIVYNSEEISVPTMLTLNGNLFICFKDQIDTLVPCVDQEGPVESVHSATLELLSNSEIAYQFALFHWQLLYNIHESELIIQMVGRDKFPGRIATNLDLLVRRFKEIQFWTTTEVLLCQQMSKRVNLIRKFIKVAVHSKSMNDLLSFFAIILGLSDVSVSRLQSTWEKLPGKIRRQFFEFQSLLNPSRNHRTYRVMVAELQPPVIPFIPLLLKDLRFADDGSKSYYDGLVNFEKMSTIAQTLRTFRHWKSKPFRVSEGRASIEAQQLIRNFKVIDDQRRLMQLSQLIQPSHKT